jgi:predicted DNA-binding antitoxin AbrB/MazE fold protein
MEQVVEAIYERGVLRPLTPINLTERQRVNLRINVLDRQAALKIIEQLGKVYEGLSDRDIADIEAIALNRSDFFGKRE